MRVFFDTNVLASALMGHGLCRDLLDRTAIGHTTLLGAPVREELSGVLISKFPVPASLWRELELKLRELEDAPSATISLSVVVPDPADVPILACAVAAKADVFVTGDEALLDLRKIENIPFSRRANFGKTGRSFGKRARNSERSDKACERTWVSFQSDRTNGYVDMKTRVAGRNTA